MQQDKATNAPLEGIRVLDFSIMLAGPYCARLLADVGAEVIKIEPPEGDDMRLRTPLRDGHSAYFGQLNAGKKSLALDLKSAEAIRLVHRLVAETDIVVENFRPGVMARFGLDYPRLQPFNPALVYCAISGYGQTGPSAGRPAYEPVIHASSGFDLAQIAHQLEPRRPDYCGIFVADVVSGTYAFGAIMAALLQCRATGIGQMVDVSMLESMLSLTLGELQNSQFDVPLPPRPIFGPVATRDGYVNLSVASERTFQNMAAAAGRKDWLTDPRFEKYQDRRVNWGQLMDELEAWSTTLPTAEVQAIFDRHGVPSSPYRTVAEAMKDPQLAHRRSLAEIHDKGGSFLALNPPFRMTASRAAAVPHVAHLGENSREVLAEAGYTADEIAALAEAGVTAAS